MSISWIFGGMILMMMGHRRRWLIIRSSPTFYLILAEQLDCFFLVLSDQGAIVSIRGSRRREEENDLRLQSWIFTLSAETIRFSFVLPFTAHAPFIQSKMFVDRDVFLSHFHQYQIGCSDGSSQQACMDFIKQNATVI
jgi:hypothetical protein